MEHEVIDIPSAKERFMGNEALYKKFLYRFPDSPTMTDLESKLAQENVEEAFREAHTMKGMVGNLSLYKLMDAASNVTEILRAGNLPQEQDMEELRAAYRDAVAAIRDIMEKDAALF